MSAQFTKNLQHGGYHSADGVVSRSTDKPGWSIVAIKTERLSTFVHRKAKSWVRNQATLVFFETDTVELEGRHIPRAQLFQLQINSQRIVFGQEV